MEDKARELQEEGSDATSDRLTLWVDLRVGMWEAVRRWDIIDINKCHIILCVRVLRWWVHDCSGFQIHNQTKRSYWYWSLANVCSLFFLVLFHHRSNTVVRQQCKVVFGGLIWEETFLLQRLKKKIASGFLLLSGFLHYSSLAGVGASVISELCLLCFAIFAFISFVAFLRSLVLCNLAPCQVPGLYRSQLIYRFFFFK